MSVPEIVGFVFGVLGVWLTTRENPWCFPIGLVNVTVSLYLFFGQRLYSDVVQQAVYIVLLSYGWYKWIHGTRHQALPVTRLSGAGWTLALAVIGAGGALMGYLFHTYTDASFPYPDAFATSTSFTAQFLVARKKIENWLLWIVVNIGYICIYLNKGLYLYAVLFLVYLALAFAGWQQWRRHLMLQTD